MSLEYNMNKRGPRTDPCGTPSLEKIATEPLQSHAANTIVLKFF